MSAKYEFDVNGTTHNVTTTTDESDPTFAKHVANILHGKLTQSDWGLLMTGVNIISSGFGVRNHHLQGKVYQKQYEVSSKQLELIEEQLASLRRAAKKP